MLDYNYFFLCDIEKKGKPEEKDVYFYDLSDDTVFVTDDPEIYNNLFTRLGNSKWQCITKIHSKIDVVLSLIQCVMFFIFLFFITRIRNVNDLELLYLFNWIYILVNYIILCILCNKETLKVKNRSEIFHVVKINGNIANQESGTIETYTVREYIKEGFSKHKHNQDYIVYLPTLIISIVLPFPTFAFFQILGLDSQPHNYLCLLRHLNRIEKTEKE